MKINLDRPIAVLDVEATGPNFIKDKIIDIYVKKVHPDGTSEVYHQLINPGMPIPDESSQIHGIYDKDVVDSPTFYKIAFNLKEFIEGCDIGGFNSNRFDIPIIMEEFYRVGIHLDINNRRLIDAFKIFVKMERRDLTSAYKFYCKKEMVNAHTASADVEATWEVIEAQLERYQDDLGENVDELHSFCKDGDFVDNGRRLIRENGKVKFNFGKHKGKSVGQVFDQEPQYFDWIIRSEFSSDTKEKLKELRIKIKNGETV